LIALVVWQQLLDGLGWVLAWIYDLVPNYGLAIIILTIAIRALLLPLGFKQIKSMQNMQALQPKLKEIQKKYKNNRQKQQEEQMKLYRESGVSPFSGCLPMILTLPFLFAMYAVIKQPAVVPAPANEQPVTGQVFTVVNNHLPEDSSLFHNVLTHENTDFLFMNLQCNLVGAGTQVPLKYKDPTDGQVKQLPGPGNPDPKEQTPAPILGKGGTTLPLDPTTQAFLDCGTKRFPDIVPYVLIVALMVGLTFFQTFQMQRASPQGAQSSQQQTITKLMPLMFAFFGLQFPAGLVVYWTVSNALQIGQQTYLLRKGHIGPEALERRIQQQKTMPANPQPKRGIMGWMTEKAQAVQQQRTDVTKQQGPRSTGSTRRKPTGQPKKGSGQPKKGGTPPRGKTGSSNGQPPSAGNPKDPTRRRKGASPGNQLRRDPQQEPTPPKSQRPPDDEPNAPEGGS
jgi:YidC/Oxa1 family membrane protein insertase